MVPGFINLSLLSEMFLSFSVLMPSVIHLLVALSSDVVPHIVASHTGIHL